MATAIVLVLISVLTFFLLWTQREESEERTDNVLPPVDPLTIEAPRRDDTLARVFSDNPLRGVMPANQDRYPTSLAGHSRVLVQDGGHWQHTGTGGPVPRANQHLVWNRLYTMDRAGGSDVHAALTTAARHCQQQLRADGYSGSFSAIDLFVHNNGPLARRGHAIDVLQSDSYAGVVLASPTFVSESALL
jgi:hypothetical protein